MRLIDADELIEDIDCSALYLLGMWLSEWRKLDDW